MLARQTQLAWTYSEADPDDSFNKRVANILNRGMPMTARPITAPVGSCRAQKAREAAGPMKKISLPSSEAPAVMGRTANGLPDNAPKGFGWVDGAGNTLADGVKKVLLDSPISKGKPRPATCMPMHRRTQELWKRTNPGIMEQHIKTPTSTAQEHFQWDEDQMDQKTRTNWQTHRKKTDFSKYVEADARLKQLIRGRGKAGI